MAAANSVNLSTLFAQCRRAESDCISFMRAGGVIVPIHAGNPVETTSRILQLVRPRCFFYHSSLCQQVRLLRPLLPEVQRWICLDRPMDEDADIEMIVSGTHEFESTPSAVYRRLL